MGFFSNRVKWRFYTSPRGERIYRGFGYGYVIPDPTTEQHLLVKQLWLDRLHLFFFAPIFIFFMLHDLFHHDMDETHTGWSSAFLWLLITYWVIPYLVMYPDLRKLERSPLSLSGRIGYDPAVLAGVKLRMSIFFGTICALLASGSLWLWSIQKNTPSLITVAAFFAVCCFVLWGYAFLASRRN